MIYVVNKYGHKPTERDIYIGRGSPLGNPYTSIKDRKTKAEHVCDSREESISNYRGYIDRELKNNNRQIAGELNRIWQFAMTGDVYLVCFCAPKPCHGDVVKEIVSQKLPANE